VADVHEVTPPERSVSVTVWLKQMGEAGDIKKSAVSGSSTFTIFVIDDSVTQPLGFRTISFISQQPATSTALAGILRFAVRYTSGVEEPGFRTSHLELKAVKQEVPNP
jgi:hypothetical protein